MLLSYLFRRGAKILKYDAHHYNDFLRLKVSFTLWFAILYGVRHFIFMGFSKLMPDAAASFTWIDVQVNQYLMLADLPAALVLLAVGHRVPDAFDLMRWIWLHGKWILLFSYIVFVIFNLKLYITGVASLDLISFVIIPDILLMIYLFRSELISDIFKEFPSKPLG